jgi:hypothetical protein|tara:strand:+ start:196 stop:321 length:126 start_codon:yes stop_codon:yes gene_type:complete
MDKRITDVNLCATVVVGILTVYITWTAYNTFKGSSSSLEKA